MMRQWINLVETANPHRALIGAIHAYAPDPSKVGAYKFGEDENEYHIGYHAILKNQTPLPAHTWLIHWTNSTSDITKQGFTKGQTDFATMGVTGGGEGLSYATRPGYNFAYRATRSMVTRRWFFRLRACSSTTAATMRSR